MARIFPFILSFIAFFQLNNPVRAQGYSPEDAVNRMKIADGLRVKLAACEPDVRQPVTLSFDDRGRMWVIQYLQYPTPAGLKPVKVDQYLRTVYDKVPEPPPKGPKGADKISIFEDREGNGHYTKVRDFVTGLNLASGMALGYSGVFVVQPPYLLYYPDKNRDDIPDSHPEVLLSGFGMHDAHAFANSLQWGPDGWLYGAQGSTVTSTIRGISFQQGIWRYHPRTKEFELFSEGGGNTWGLDFDRQGNAIAGTNWGDAVCLHQVQGAYYIKGFAKHGELHNPHAYGYFDHVPYKGFKGGHVTCGGIIYQGGALPKQFDNAYIAANPLANALYWHVLEAKGSSFTGRFGGDFLVGGDTWFRPVDCLTGPDGALYVADWYDKRINHVDPVDNWDRTNGRIYKVEGTDAKPLAKFDLSKMSSKELVDLLRHRNGWFSSEARRLLGERRDAEVLPAIQELVLQNQDEHSALEALWALYVSGGFTEALAETLLKHPNPDLRAWTVRFLGDTKKVSAAMADRLAHVASSEKSPRIRCQLACSAKRLPGKDCLPIVAALLRHEDDITDPFIPLLIWWAIEDKAISDRERVLQLLDTPGAWNNAIVKKYLVERLARRYMAEGKEADLATCARLLAAAPGEESVNALIGGMEKALEGRRLKNSSPELAKQIGLVWSQDRTNLARIRLAIRLRNESAYDYALARINDANAPEGDRRGLIEILGQIGKPDCVSPLLKLLEDGQPPALRVAALSALQSFQESQIAEKVLALYPKMPGDLRNRSLTLLLSRPAPARAFLEQVDAGKIAPKEVPLEQLRRLLLHKDDAINRLVEKHWGKIGQEPPGEKKSRIASVLHILGGGKGDPVRGKELFTKACATCHTLFGEGGKVGPELTGHDRKNRSMLVMDIVDPSAIVRKEYVAFNVTTKNGLVLNGLLAEATPNTVTLLDAKNERTVVARDAIEEMSASPISLMPEKLLDEFDDQQTRDLFSYLQGDGPVAAPKSSAIDPNHSGKKLRVCLISGSLEYKSDESLAAFEKYLEEHFPVKCSRAFRKTDDDLPGLEALDNCDVALFFTRRLTIDGKQLERIKKYCEAGKPIVAVRTASHGFQNWLAMDNEVLGGNYKGHYGEGLDVKIAFVDKAKSHPVMAGVKSLSLAGSLYKNTGLAKDVTVLATGSIPDHSEPVAWTREHKGGRVFYTSLGHPKDFEDENFRRMLVNALFWTAKREIPDSTKSSKR
ncbi:MAG: PVC-type heme-binding CxxCH protein [Gemmataceae bacterium]